VPRIAFVLGAGGIVGHAFHAGVLGGLADATGWDPREADLVVGTSAGAVIGALVRAGFSASDLYADVRDAPMSPDGARLIAARSTGRGPIPNRSEVVRSRRPSVPGRNVLAGAARGRVRPGVLAAALMPEGVVSTEFVAAGLRPLFAGGWPHQPFWVNAVHLGDGRRVTFGRESAPEVDVATAIAASCAIPSFFEPVNIEGERYVDGGVHSPTNADVLAGGDPFDLVLISSPMSIAGRNVRLSPDEPMRRLARLALTREVRKLRAEGTIVVAFQATVTVATEMGLNAMDPSRRAPVARHAYESALRRLDRVDARDARELLMKTRRL
jgi:NTE family protein